jgi:hypothetical protein
MVDRVRALKQESSATGGNGADDVEYPTPVKNNQDALDSRGYFVQNDTSNDTTSLITRDASDNMTFQDGVTGPWTLSELAASASGISEAQHEGLRTLAHDLVDTSYDSATWVGSDLTNVTTWTDNTMTTKVREIQATYSAHRLTQVIEIEYDLLGTETYRVVEDYSYTGNKLANVVRTRI